VAAGRWGFCFIFSCVCGLCRVAPCGRGLHRTVSARFPCLWSIGIRQRVRSSSAQGALVRGGGTWRPGGHTPRRPKARRPSRSGVELDGTLTGAGVGSGRKQTAHRDTGGCGHGGAAPRGHCLARVGGARASAPPRASVHSAAAEAQMSLRGSNEAVSRKDTEDDSQFPQICVLAYICVNRVSRPWRQG